MCDIDYILDLFDWNQSPEKQAEGLNLAKTVKSVHVFLQPADKNHCKNVWENCAIAISQRTDEELRPYLGKLLDWLVDMNWPGAWRIFERLQRFEDREWLSEVLDIWINMSIALKEDIWESNLKNFLNSYKSSDKFNNL